MWESIIDTCDDINSVELVLRIDDDDKDTINKVKLFPHLDRIKTIIAPRGKTMGEMHNVCINVCSGNIMMPGSDDFLFRTKSWDSLVRDAFDQYPDKILLLHCSDGLQNEALATTVFVHRKWVEILGYLIPPYFVADFGDKWLDHVAHDVGRKIYFPAVLIEHMHYTAGKSDFDEVYRDRRRMKKEAGGKRAWKETGEKRHEDVAKLQNYINNFKKK
jgi:hypothetical protein